MAGEARTSKFMLGAATVMLGAKNQHHSLTVDLNSIGLVKNLQVSSDPSYLELTQGVKNVIVDSAMTNNPIRVSFELYEASGRNLRYALGLDGSGYVEDATVHEVVSSLSSAATTLLISGDVTGGGAGKLAVDDWIVIQDLGDDKVSYAKITAIAYSSPNTTVTFTNHPLPEAYSADAQVRQVNSTAAGSKEDQPYLSAKIVGKLSNGDTVTILIPKLRIVKGFNLGFTTDKYSSMPIELTPYELTTTERTAAKLANNSGVMEIFAT